MRAARALDNGWVSLSALYVYEVMLLFESNITRDIENKAIPNSVLNQLQTRNMPPPQAMNFMRLMKRDKPFPK